MCCCLSVTLQYCIAYGTENDLYSMIKKCLCQNMLGHCKASFHQKMIGTILIITTCYTLKYCPSQTKLQMSHCCMATKITKKNRAENLLRSSSFLSSSIRYMCFQSCIEENSNMSMIRIKPSIAKKCFKFEDSLPEYLISTQKNQL